MLNERLKSDNKAIRSITYLGVFVNIGLCILKIIVGLFAGSIALVADGIHSFSDMITDAAVLIGVHLGAKEPDHDHPYGHGRMETFSAAVVALILISVGALMIYKAGMQIARFNADPDYSPTIGPAAVFAALISVIAKEILYWLTKKVAVKTHSTSLYANAWHHRSDAFSSLAVVAGLMAVGFGYAFGDQVAAIIVGILIIFVAAKILTSCLEEFSQRSVDGDTVEQIEKIIAQKKGIKSYHHLRTRTAGREIFMDLHILVDPSLNIAQAHEIAESLENKMHDVIPRPVNIMVHIEPDVPELRK